MAPRYETTKMCPALTFEGHSFRFDKLVVANLKKGWRCCTRDCNGCIYSKNEEENSDVQTRTPHREHCIPDPDARLFEIVITDLKIHVRIQLTPIPTLYSDITALLSEISHKTRLPIRPPYAEEFF